MKSFYLLLLNISIVGSLLGQGLWLSNEVADISSIDKVSLELKNKDRLLAGTRSQGKEIGPKRFAAPIKTKITTDKRGSWESVSHDRMVWRLSVESPNAYSLNFAFKEFYLPPSGALFLYDKNKSYVIGPITNVDNDIHNEWWSPILPFDEVIVEVQVDSDELSDLNVTLGQVNHDYVGFGLLVSGSCNVDVSCSDEDGLDIIDEFRDIINSVGMYSVDGVDACSGALINTTRNDCTPYFLTAFHCEVRADNAASVVVYWNYENTFCRAPNSPESGRNGNGPRTNFNSGSTVIAEYDPSDFTLLRLDDDVNPDFSPFYSGWDVGGEVFDSTLSIHHPNSEEKRISFDFDDSEPFADQFFMRVNNWELGTTEPGSSGAPLYNMQKQIIGQLTGGQAACGINEFDDFGMMKINWEGGGTPETRLKDWLDPDNTGRLVLDGRSCVDVVSITPVQINICNQTKMRDTVMLTIRTGFDNGASLALADLPEGLKASFEQSTITRGVPTRLFLDYTEVKENFDGSIDILITDQFGTTRNNLRLGIYTDIPGPVELIQPSNGAENLNFEVNFQWIDSAPSYSLEIATDPEFNNMVNEIVDLENSSVDVRGLEPSFTYYWRVKGFNTCGSGVLSAVSSFSTGMITCESFEYTGETQIILEESNVVSSVISITEDKEIFDVNILNVRGTHTWISDLEFRLIGPDGTKVDLLINGCSDEQDFNVSFDDESDNINYDCPFLGGKDYRPIGTLSIFDGLSAEGDWTLEITDDVFIDGGTFIDWTLELCLDQSSKVNNSINSSVESIFICEKIFDPISIDINLAGTFGDRIFASLIDVSDGSIIGEREEFAPSDDISLVLSDISALINQTNPLLMVLLEDGEDRFELTIPVVIQRDELNSTLIEPADQAMEVDRNTVFKWSNDVGVIGTQFLLSTADGQVILDTLLENGEDTIQSPIRLEKFTEYQWSIVSIGECSPDLGTETNNFITTMSVPTNDIMNSSIKVYPNPSSGKVSITNEMVWNQRATLDIFDMTGSLMLRADLNQAKVEINTSVMSPGIYMYQIIDGEKKYTDKLVIIR